MPETFRLRWAGLHQSLTWRVLTNAGWASAATPITIGLGIIQTAMLARMLGPEGIGAIALFGAVSALFGSVFKLTSAEAAMVYVTKALAEGDKDQSGRVVRYCYLVDLLTSLLASGAVVVSAMFLPHLLKLAPGQEWLQGLFGLTLVFQATYWTSHALLRVANRFSWTFYQTLGRSMLEVVVVGMLFIHKAGLVEVVFVLVGIALFDGVTLFLMAYAALRSMGVGVISSPGPWWGMSGEVRRFQILGYGRGVTKTLYNYLDVLMIGYLSNPVAVGLFRSAKQLTDPLGIPVQALVSSISPEYSRLWFAGDKSHLRRIVFRFSVVMLVVLGVLAIGVILFADPIVRIVLGTAFLPAKGVLLILILATLLGLAMTPLNSLQTATGSAGPSTAAGIATVVVQAALMITLVPKLGIVGAAWAKVGGLLASLTIMLPTGLMRLQSQPPVTVEAE